MRLRLTVLLLLIIPRVFGQQPKPLPEFIFIPQAADKYEWKRVMNVRPRTLFNNMVATDGTTQWSFGGYNTERVQRVLCRIEGGALINDSIAYPGAGFANNVFFVHDSALYIGGGLDSGKTRFSFEDFWRYDLRAKRWSRLRDLPFYNLHPLSIFPDSNRIIVLAMALQRPELRNSDPVCYSYNPADDRWTVISQQLSRSEIYGGADTTRTGGAWAGTFRFGDDLYILLQPWQEIDNSFFRLNLSTGAWSRLKPFPSKERSLSASFAFSDGTFGYMGGGRVRHSGGNSREVFRYDPERDAWERIADLPQGVRYAKGWQFRGERYLGFGINDKTETVRIWKLQRKR